MNRRPQGRVRLFCRGLAITPWVHNDALPDWSTAVVNLLTSGDRRYVPSAMYMEFLNAGGAKMPPPVFDPDDPASGAPYYAGLASSSDLDYLRVPLIWSRTDTDDPVNFPNGNTARFFGQSSGSVGTFGKPFAAASFSMIYGGALVATVAGFGDRTGDLVLARFYLQQSQQQAKPLSSEIDLEWQNIIR